MDFFDAINTSSSALSAQRLRMNLISGNLANVNTTRTRMGGPYRRKEAIFAAESMDSLDCRTSAGTCRFVLDLFVCCISGSHRAGPHQDNAT